jgi:hypothetical protein
MTLLASAFTDWVTLAFAGVATLIAAWQLPKIGNQLRLAAETNVSSAYSVVSERMASLRDILAADDAALYPYFYSGLDPDDEHDRSLPKRPNEDVLQLACEAIVDFADVCVEQRNSIRHAEMDWSTWDAYFRYLFQNSPVLQRFLRENKDFYPDYLTSVFGYIVVRVEHTGEVASEWQVEESEEGLQGYPWIRTWLITKIRKDEDKSGNTTTMEAAVQAPDRVATTVGVQFTWEDVDARERDALEPVLYSWVLWQLKSSNRLQTANIVDDRSTRYALLGPITWRRRLFGPRRRPRERFLAPEVPTISRRSRPLP